MHLDNAASTQGMDLTFKGDDPAPVRSALAYQQFELTTLINTVENFGRDATRVQRPFHGCSWPPGVGLRPSRRPSTQGRNREFEARLFLLNLRS